MAAAAAATSTGWAMGDRGGPQRAARSCTTLRSQAQRRNVCQSLARANRSPAPSIAFADARPSSDHMLCRRAESVPESSSTGSRWWRASPPRPTTPSAAGSAERNEPSQNRARTGPESMPTGQNANPDGVAVPCGLGLGSASARMRDGANARRPSCWVERTWKKKG